MPLLILLDPLNSADLRNATWEKRVPSKVGVYITRIPTSNPGVPEKAPWEYDAYMFVFGEERGMLSTVDGTWIDEFDDEVEWAGPFDPRLIGGGEVPLEIPTPEEADRRLASSPLINEYIKLLVVWINKDYVGENGYVPIPNDLTSLTIPGAAIVRDAFRKQGWKIQFEHDQKDGRAIRISRAPQSGSEE